MSLGNESTTLPPDHDSALLSLQKTASSLLAEFKAFQDYLATRRQQQEVDLRIYRKGLKAESEAIDRAVSGKDHTPIDDERTPNDTLAAQHARLIRTTNIPHYHLWWSLAKQCRGIRGLGRRVPIHQKVENGSRGKTVRHPQKSGEEVQIDVMANDGQEWIKISSVTEKRLLFEVAKQGWEEYGDVSTEDEAEPDENRSRDGLSNHNQPSPDQPKLELLRIAESLQSASHSVRVRYVHPRVHIILPNIPSDPQTSVAALVADIRATGTKVTCGKEASSGLSPASDNTASDMPSTNGSLTPEVLAQMSPASTHQPSLTSTLNIDTSILIALISDQCHYKPSTLPLRPSLNHVRSKPTIDDKPCTQSMTTQTTPPSRPISSYHKAIQQQMAQEEAKPLLPTTLYPLLAGRELVCTAAAADRARLIVGTMGMETERARARILLRAIDSETTADMDPNSRERTPQARWESLSSYPLTAAGMQLPIREIDVDVEDLVDKAKVSQTTGSLVGPGTSSSPRDLGQRLLTHLNSTQPPFSDLNASVLFYGWAHNLVTITSNGLAVRAVEKGLNEVLDAMEAEGWEAGDDDPSFPLLWLVDESRSLVGKEKQGQR